MISSAIMKLVMLHPRATAFIPNKVRDLNAFRGFLFLPLVKIKFELFWTFIHQSTNLEAFKKAQKDRTEKSKNAEKYRMLFKSKTLECMFF